MLKWTCQSMSSKMVITAFRPCNMWTTLGIVFEYHMTMHENITKTCASCYFHIRNISSIRVHIWFIDWWGYHTARLRICVIPNWLLQLASVWNTRSAIKKLQLQSVQHCPCRHAFVKVQQHKVDGEEIALAACEISHNIQSIMLLTFKALHGVETTWRLCCKVNYMPSRSLRSKKFTHHAESTPQIRMP